MAGFLSGSPLGFFSNVLVNSQDISWGGCGEVVEFASGCWLMGWSLSERLSPSHPLCPLSQLNWEFLQAEGREMVPSAGSHPRREWLAWHLQDIHSISRSRAAPAASVPRTVRRAMARWEKRSPLSACLGTDRCVEMPGVWFLYGLGMECDFPSRGRAGGQVAAVVAHLFSR